MDIKEFYDAKLDTIKEAQSSVSRNTYELRMLLTEIRNTTDLTPASYKALLGLVDAGLSRMQGDLFIIRTEAGCREMETEEEQEEGDADDVH